MLAQVFNPTEIKKNGQPQDQHTLQHGATVSPSQQRPWCCLPPAKTTAMPETASTHHGGSGSRLEAAPPSTAPRVASAGCSGRDQDHRAPSQRQPGVRCD